MSRTPVWYLLAGAAALAAHPAPARGQDGPYGRIVVVPSGGYWGYYYPRSAVADIIDSQGRYLISQQQAALLYQDVLKAKLETRKAEIQFWLWKDQTLYEAAKARRERMKRDEIERAAEEPPEAEIYSGGALNTLLAELKKQPSLDGPSTAVDPEWLPHVHVRSGADFGLVLLNKDKVHWPALLAIAFADDRKQLEQLLHQLREQAATSDGPKPELLQKLRTEASALRARLADGARDQRNASDVLWTPDNQIAAARLLKALDHDAFTLQSQPEAAFYLRPLQAQTVGELVKYMKARGLFFAEAAAGDQRHYTALRHALAEELNRVRPAPSASQR
jgi:hypothetical protein